MGRILIAEDDTEIANLERDYKVSCHESEYSFLKGTAF